MRGTKNFLFVLSLSENQLYKHYLTTPHLVTKIEFKEEVPQVTSSCQLYSNYPVNLGTDIPGT